MSSTKIYIKLAIFVLLSTILNTLVCLSAEERDLFKIRTEENLAVSRDLQDEWYQSSKSKNDLSVKSKRDLIVKILENYKILTDLKYEMIYHNSDVSPLKYVYPGWNNTLNNNKGGFNPNKVKVLVLFSSNKNGQPKCLLLNDLKDHYLDETIHILFKRIGRICTQLMFLEPIVRLNRCEIHNTSYTENSKKIEFIDDLMTDFFHLHLNKQRMSLQPAAHESPYSIVSNKLFNGQLPTTLLTDRILNMRLDRSSESFYKTLLPYHVEMQKEFRIFVIQHRSVINQINLFENTENIFQKHEEIISVGQQYFDVFQKKIFYPLTMPVKTDLLKTYAKIMHAKSRLYMLLHFSTFNELCKINGRPLEFPNDVIDPTLPKIRVCLNSDKFTLKSERSLNAKINENSQKSPKENFSLEKSAVKSQENKKKVLETKKETPQNKSIQPVKLDEKAEKAKRLELEKERIKAAAAKRAKSLQKARVAKEVRLAKEAKLAERAKYNEVVRSIKEVKVVEEPVVEEPIVGEEPQIIESNNATEIINIATEKKLIEPEMVFKLDAPEFIPGQFSLFITKKPPLPDELILSNGFIDWSYKIIQKNQKYYISYHNYLGVHNVYPILVGSYAESKKSEKTWQFMNEKLNYIQWNSYGLNQNFGPIMEASLHLIHRKVKYPKINRAAEKESIIVIINESVGYPLALHCSLKNDDFYPDKDHLLKLKSTESVNLSVMDKYFSSNHSDGECKYVQEGVRKTHWQNMHKKISEEVFIHSETGSTINSVVVKSFMGCTILHVKPREGKPFNVILEVPTEKMVKKNNLSFTKKLSTIIHSCLLNSETLYPFVFDEHKPEIIKSINLYVIMNQTFAMVHYSSPFLRMIYPLDRGVGSRS